MALDILHDNWGPYTHTEVENALKAYLAALEDRINQAIQEGGVGLTDLSQEVQALLAKANTALQPDSIAAWAKAQNKPGYTADEITGITGFQNLLAKLQDMDQKIQAAAQSGVDPDDEMSSTSEKPVQNKVIKAYVDGLIQGLQNVLNTITQDGATQGAIDTFNEVKTFLDGINNQETLAAKLALLVPQSRTINGKALSSNVTIGMNDIPGLVEAIANAGSGAVSVTTNQDGTFVIRVGETDYTINLNHTHEGMAKLVVDTAANLPDASEMESDTIYGELDDGEIATIYLGGYPFYGGGGSSSGPVLRRPADGATIDMGQTTSGTVSKTINVKGKSLTQALIIQLTGTGYSFGTTQPSGVTRDSATQLTIPASSISAVNSLNGVDIVVVYTGSDADENASGTLGITSASPDSISTEATLVANKVTYEDLAGVKLTGTQWLQTDYYPNANTEFELRCRFIENSNSQLIESSNAKGYIFSCPTNSGDEKKFIIYQFARDSRTQYNAYGALLINDTSYNQAGHTHVVQYLPALGLNYQDFLVDNLKMFYRKSSSNGVFGFNSGGTEQTVTTSLKSSTMESPMKIGINNDGVIYCRFDLVIYELKITENGNLVRDWVAKTRNGVPGLYDTVNNTFMSSETAKTSGLASDELVAIPLT